MGATESPVHDEADYLPDEAKDILKSLASEWDDVLDANALQVIPLKGAMTNEVFEIKWPTTQEASRKVLVRIYGEGVDIFFDRNDEIRTFECMSQHGQGPRLLGRFGNLTRLLKKDGFKWTPEATEAFETLKQKLLTAPTLALPDFSKSFVVETDACGSGIGAILMQQGQPLAFFSKALSPRHQGLNL